MDPRLDSRTCWKEENFASAFRPKKMTHPSTCNQSSFLQTYESCGCKYNTKRIGTFQHEYGIISVQDSSFQHLYFFQPFSCCSSKLTEEGICSYLTQKPTFECRQLLQYFILPGISYAHTQEVHLNLNKLQRNYI